MGSDPTSSASTAVLRFREIIDNSAGQYHNDDNGGPFHRAASLLSKQPRIGRMVALGSPPRGDGKRPLPVGCCPNLGRLQTKLGQAANLVRDRVLTARQEAEGCHCQLNKPRRRLHAHNVHNSSADNVVRSAGRSLSQYVRARSLGRPVTTLTTIDLIMCKNN